MKKIGKSNIYNGEKRTKRKILVYRIRVITKLPKSYKGKVKTHNYIDRQNQSTTGKLNTTQQTKYCATRKLLKYWAIYNNIVSVFMKRVITD
jgi:hypothetical protein